MSEGTALFTTLTLAGLFEVRVRVRTRGVAVTVRGAHSRGFGFAVFAGGGN